MRAAPGLCKLVLAAMLGCALSSASAQGELHLRMSMQLTHDSNLFRLSDDRDIRSLGQESRSDWISSVALGLDADVPISQQRLQLSLQANDVRYRSADSLNYTGSNVNAKWLWRAGKRASGTLGASREEVLSDFADLATVDRNIRVTRKMHGALRFWLMPDWWLVSILDRVEISNERAQRSADHEDQAASMGVEYRTAADNSVVFQVRRTDGVSPNDIEFAGFPFDNDFKQSDVETVVDWRVNGFWRTRARLGYTQRKHDEFSDRDFSGLTGYWSQDWFATGKLAFNVTAKREIGSYQDFTTNYIETTALTFTPTWVYSDKLRFQAGLELRKRDYQGDPNIFLATGTRRNDDITSLSVSALYAPWRNIDFALSLRQQDRNSNVSSFDYNATTLDATLNIGF